MTTFPSYKMIADPSFLTFDQHLRELYRDRSFCNIKVRSGERVWDLHQVVLARHSVRFLQPQTEDIIELDPNFCPEEAVDMVIGYLYADKITMNDDQLGSIMAVAASLGVDDLIRICCKRIRKSVSNNTTNPLKYLAMAESHGTQELADFLMDVASQRIRQVAEDTEEFEKLSQENLCKLIEGRKLDGFLVGIVVSWMEKEPGFGARNSAVLKCMDLKEAGIKELDRLHKLAIPGSTATLLNCYRNFCIGRLPKMETSKPVIEWPILEEHSLVAIGGKTDGSGPPGTCAMILSPRMNLPYWRPLPSIPPSHNCEYFPRIQWVDNKIIVFGGCPEGNSVIMYEPDKCSWRHSTTMPHGKRLFATAVLGGIVYVIGGSTKTCKSIAGVDKFDPRNEQWSPSPPLPVPLTGSSCCEHRGTLLTVGGFVWKFEEKVPCATVFRMDRRTERWSMYTSLPAAMMFTSVTSVHDELFIFGGAVRKSLNDVETSTDEIYRMDTATGKWSLVGNLRQARHLSSAITLGGKVYVAAGVCTQYGSTSLASIECWDPSLNVSRTMGPTTNLPFPHNGTVVCAITPCNETLGHRGSKTLLNFKSNQL